MAESARELPTFTLQQSAYEQEIAQLAARFRGPVCQIGARAQMIDAQARTWRTRLAAMGVRFIGADLEPGDNVDAVFDLCAPLSEIEAALAPALGGERLNGIVCAHLLEHVRRPWVAAANLEALLAPGGLLFVQVPWSQAFHAFPDDLWRISLSGLIELFPGLRLADAFTSGASNDVAWRLARDGTPDFSLAARRMEAKVFQLVFSAEENRRLLGSLKEPRAYLSRGYLPTLFVSALFEKA
ncbi:MAG TPA: methyltransferase domain-containing protein [Kiloniellales bacterium]|nr:methyltransferase domain-containing protein [Kiloniellales bacterium]